jgi:hypothetical protein
MAVLMRELVNENRSLAAQNASDMPNVLDADYAPGDGILTLRYPRTRWPPA